MKWHLCLCAHCCFPSSDAIIALGRLIPLDIHLPHLLILLLFLLLCFLFSPVSSSVTSSLLPLPEAPVSALSLSPAVLITHLESTAYILSMSPSLCPHSSSRSVWTEAYYYHNAHNHCRQQMHFQAVCVHIHIWAQHEALANEENDIFSASILHPHIFIKSKSIKFHLFQAQKRWSQSKNKGKTNTVCTQTHWKMHKTNTHTPETTQTHTHTHVQSTSAALLLRWKCIVVLEESSGCIKHSCININLHIQSK